MKLVVFLIISLRLSAECCHEYECNLIPVRENCMNIDCFWENSTGQCRVKTCSDRDSFECETYHCKYTSSCVDILCSDYNSDLSDCPSHYEFDGSYGSSRVYCISTGSACVKGVKETCDNYTSAGQSTCEGKSVPAGDCGWVNNTCVTISSCSCYSAANCKSIANGPECILDNGTCREVKFTCADIGESLPCITSKMSCIFEGGVCRSKKCSDYTYPSECNSSSEYPNYPKFNRCHWFDGACHVAECSDWSSTSVSKCESNNGWMDCEYNIDDNTCSLIICGNRDSSSCRSNGAWCYWLNSCPVKNEPQNCVNGKDNDDGGSASGIIFAPALLVTLLLVLFW